MNDGHGHAPWPAIAAIVIGVLAAWAGERVYVRHEAAERQRVAATLGRRAAPAAPADGVAADDATAAAEDVFSSIKIPEHLPEIRLSDPAGKLRSIADWRGKSLILNFWATWCAPCRREIPLLEALAREWEPRGVAIIGIAVDHRPEVLEFAERLHIGYPLLVGEQDALDAATALGVASPAFPFTVFTDRRGEIVAIFVGELHRAQAQLILDTMQSLNADRLPLAAARHQISVGLHDLKNAASS